MIIPDFPILEGRKRLIFGAVIFLIAVTAGLSLRFLAEKLRRPAPTPKPEATVTIPEGYNLREIQAELRDAGVGNTDGITGFTVGMFRDPGGRDFGFLADAPAGASLEGFLFPDTYHFWLDSSATSTVKKFLDNFDLKLLPEWRDEIKKQNKKIYDVITMASIVEKEISNEEDRPLVAGILWNRLKIGMPLQADATLCFIKFQPGKKCILTAADKKIDSPYNTYLYAGLPAGPIGNPGVSAIRAAIFPKTSSNLYYLSTPAGRTIPSETLDEHNVAKRKYLK